LRVLQFNTLADGLAQHGDFLRCDARSLQWGARQPLLEAEIFRLKPDIIGLQEVNRYDDWLEAALRARGYESVFLRKEESPCLKYGFPGDGCVLAWDAARFERVALDARPYAEAGFRQGAIVATLRERAQGGRALVVATTHLKAKPEGAPARMQQARLLGERLARAASAMAVPGGARADVVVTGDFNCERSEGVIDELGEAFGGGGFTDAFVELQGDGLAFTTWKFRPAKDGGTKEKREWIDYVLYAGADLHVASTLSMPTEEQIGEGALPCDNYPSDHLSVGVELEWKVD